MAGALEHQLRIGWHRIQHRQHRNIQPLRQFRRTGAAIKQAHHAFNQDQIGLLGGSVEPGCHIFGASHPAIERMHRGTAGQLMPVRIQKIRPTLEHAHCAPLAAVQTCQGGGEGGFALPRSRGSN